MALTDNEEVLDYLIRDVEQRMREHLNESLSHINVNFSQTMDCQHEAIVVVSVALASHLDAAMQWLAQHCAEDDEQPAEAPQMEEQLKQFLRTISKD